MSVFLLVKLAVVENFKEDENKKYGSANEVAIEDVGCDHEEVKEESDDDSGTNGNLRHGEAVHKAGGKSEENDECVSW
jgi:hypothetical protein